MGILSKKPSADDCILGIIFPDCRIWEDNEEYHVTPKNRFVFKDMSSEQLEVMKFIYHGCIKCDKPIKNANFKCEELFCGDIYDSNIIADKINCVNLSNTHVLTKQINFEFNPILKNTTIKTRNLWYSGQLFATDCNIKVDNVSIFTSEFDKIIDDIYKKKKPAWYIAGLDNKIRPNQIIINSQNDLRKRFIELKLSDAEPGEPHIKTVDGYYALALPDMS